MSKRFFDTDLWINRPWFIELTPGEKAAWYYLLSTCDNVGVCNPVRRIADASIGEAIDWDALPGKTNGNIVVMDSGKWWLKDFCTFQHPDIDPNSTSNAVQSYIKLLKQHGLFEQYMYCSGTVQELTKEKEEVKDKEQVREKEKEKEGKKEYAPTVHMTEAEHEKLVDKYGTAGTKKMIDKLSNYKGAKGKKYKDDYRAILNWVVEAVGAHDARDHPQVGSVGWTCKKCGAVNTHSGTMCIKCREER